MLNVGNPMLMLLLWSYFTAFIFCMQCSLLLMQ